MITVPEHYKVGVIEGNVRGYLNITVFNWVDNGDGTTSNLHIENESIVSESMMIEQSISDDSDIKFGGCIASRFEIDIANMPDLTGGYITVFFTQAFTAPTYPGAHLYPGVVYPGGYAGNQEFAVFSGDIISCKLNKNRITRHLVAYDRFYSRGQIDCTRWYQSWWGNAAWHTLGDLRQAVVSRFGINENNPGEALPGDNLEVSKLDGTLTVIDILHAVCEISGCFMFFGGNGKIDYIYINQEKYTGGANTEEYTFYKDFEYEEYEKQRFSHLLVQGFEGGSVLVACQDETTEPERNVYAIKNEILTTGYTADSWSDPNYAFNGWRVIVGNIYEADSFNVAYTPCRLTAGSRLWVELGDKILVHQTVYDEQGNSTVETVESIVLSRTISGINALTDDITAEGENKIYTEEDYSNE